MKVLIPVVVDYKNDMSIEISFPDMKSEEQESKKNKSFIDLCKIFRAEYIQTVSEIFSEDLHKGRIRSFKNNKKGNGIEVFKFINERKKNNG